MLKDELPKLFELESEFIRPLFQNFYYMQLNIFYTLNEKMKAMEIDYFDFSVGIEEQYEAKRGDVKDRAEALSIVHFKGTGKRRTSPPPPRFIYSLPLSASNLTVGKLAHSRGNQSMP